MIVFTVPGEPQGPGRERINVYTRRQGHEAPPFLDLLKLYATEQKPEELLTEAVVVDLLVYRSAPGGITKQQRGKTFGDYMAERLRPLTKTGVENYAKAVLDALDGIIWHSNGQVVDLRVRKYFSENPRVVIRIRPLADLRPRVMNHPELEQDWQTGPPDWIDDALGEWEDEQDGKRKAKKGRN